jgi:hypothetical protein
MASPKFRHLVGGLFGVLLLLSSVSAEAFKFPKKVDYSTLRVDDQRGKVLEIVKYYIDNPDKFFPAVRKRKNFDWLQSEKKITVIFFDKRKNYTITIGGYDKTKESKSSRR